MRYLALGDSYTIGEGMPPADRWPVQLARQLRARGIALDDPRIIAVTGWTTDELAVGMDQADLEPPCALVSLLIGVNNQYRGRDTASYRADFTQLLHRAIGLAGDRADRVLVISIPDWGMTPLARKEGREPAQVARDIDAYNSAARDITLDAGARHVDITPLTRRLGRQPDMLIDDGLHPSAGQYRQWLAAILPAALDILA